MEKESSLPSVDLDAVSVVAGTVLVVAGVVTFAAPFQFVRDLTAGRPQWVKSVVGMSLIGGGVLLISKPMFGPIIDGVRILIHMYSNILRVFVMGIIYGVRGRPRCGDSSRASSSSTLRLDEVRRNEMSGSRLLSIFSL